jgi:hypothetical protein
VGFSEAEAYLIASADQRIDLDADTDSQEMTRLGDINQCLNWHAFLNKGRWARDRGPGDPLGFRGGFENFLIGAPEFDATDPNSLIRRIAVAESKGPRCVTPDIVEKFRKDIIKEIEEGVDELDENDPSDGPIEYIETIDLLQKDNERRAWGFPPFRGVMSPATHIIFARVALTDLTREYDYRSLLNPQDNDGDGCIDEDLPDVDHDTPTEADDDRDGRADEDPLDPSVLGQELIQVIEQAIQRGIDTAIREREGLKASLLNRACDPGVGYKEKLVFFGQYLHFLQDIFSHWAYFAEPAPKHFKDTGSGVDPDSLASNEKFPPLFLSRPKDPADMLRETLSEMKRFRRDCLHQDVKDIWSERDIETIFSKLQANSDPSWRINEVPSLVRRFYNLPPPGYPAAPRPGFDRAAVLARQRGAIDAELTSRSFSRLPAGPLDLDFDQRGGWGNLSELQPLLHVPIYSLDFGEVPVNDVKTLFLIISNLGAQDLEIKGAALGGADYGEFSVPNLDLVVRTLKGGEDYELKITFNPNSEGDKVANIVIEAKPPTHPGQVVIQLRGRGIATPQNRFTWNDPNTGGRLQIEVRITPQADGRLKWEYLVTNLSYNPPGGNGFSGFQVFFADSVGELSGQFGPEGWGMNSSVLGPKPPEGATWDKVSGRGVMPGAQVTFGFFTAPREPATSFGMAHTWVGGTEDYMFTGELLVPGNRK